MKTFCEDKIYNLLNLNYPIPYLIFTLSIFSIITSDINNKNVAVLLACMKSKEIPAIYDAIIISFVILSCHIITDAGFIIPP